MKTLFSSIRLLGLLTMLTGLTYPLAIWAVGRVGFPEKAEGSLLMREGHCVGSRLIAQKTTSARYFWPRPSAGDYATVPSGASQLGWTSAKLVERVRADRAAGVPQALLTTSGSGLDPDVTVDGILEQVPRVASARHWTMAERKACEDLVATLATSAQFGPSCINVLTLNLRLDRLSAER